MEYYLKYQHNFNSVSMTNYDNFQVSLHGEAQNN